MRRSVAVVTITAAFAWPCLVRAQGSTAHDAEPTRADVARAESLFDAAKALLDSGQTVDACAKFAESKRLAAGLGVTLYLADCYERIGRTASAWTEFRSAEGLARQRGDKRVELAHGRAQAIEPNLDRLTIVVAPTVPRAELQVLRDGVVVPPEEWGVAVPVDPGDHVVAFSAPGHAQRTIATRVGAEAASASVQIDRLDDAASATVAVPAAAFTPIEGGSSQSASPEAGGESTHPGSTRRWVGAGVAGVGIIGAGIGAAFGLMAKSKLDQSNDGPCNSSDHCTAQGVSLRHDAKGAATVSTIAFVAGAAALVTGAVVYLTTPRAAATVALTPLAGPGVGGALLEGSF